MLIFLTFVSFRKVTAMGRQMLKSKNVTWKTFPRLKIGRKIKHMGWLEDPTKLSPNYYIFLKQNMLLILSDCYGFVGSSEI